jgi:hypothetical protein
LQDKQGAEQNLSLQTKTKTHEFFRVFCFFSTGYMALKFGKGYCASVRDDRFVSSAAAPILSHTAITFSEWWALSIASLDFHSAISIMVPSSA